MALGLDSLAFRGPDFLPVAMSGLALGSAVPRLFPSLLT